MMFQGKEVSVRLSEEADKVYQELNRIVGEEKLKGIDSSFHQTLLRSINRVSDLSFCRRSGKKETDSSKVY